MRTHSTNRFGHLAIGLVYRETRRFDEALAALHKAAELTGGAPMVLGWLGLALAESGDIAGARDLLGRLRGMPHAAYVPPSSIAHIHLGLGEVDAFFESMNRAIDRARSHGHADEDLSISGPRPQRLTVRCATAENELDVIRHGSGRIMTCGTACRRPSRCRFHVNDPGQHRRSFLW